MLLHEMALNRFYGSIGQSEEITTTCINSLYVRDADAALVSFEIEADTVYPVSSWRSEGSDYDIFAAIKRTENYDTARLYLNADSTSSAGKNKNLLSSSFHREDLYPIVVDPFEPAQGAIVYQQMNNHGQLNFSRLDGWPKLREKIKRIRVAQPADVMALMQGLIKCRRLVS